MPSRKRPKPNPTVDQPSTSADQAAKHLPVPSANNLDAAAESSSSVDTASNETKHRDHSTSLKPTKENSNKELKSKSSWYGTWPRKSTASTQVARETILADKTPKTTKNVSSSSDLSRFESKRAHPSPLAGKPPSMDPGKSRETLDITMGGALEDDNKISGADMEEDIVVPERGAKDGAADVPAPTQSVKENPVTDDNSQRPATASGWLGGWLNRQPTQEEGRKEEALQAAKAPAVIESVSQSPKIPGSKDEVQTSATNVIPPTLSDTVEASSTTTASWFGFWPSISSTATTEPPVVAQVPVKVNKLEDAVMEEAPGSAAQPAPRPVSGSSWAFWSTDTSKKPINSDIETSKSGQLAVSGEASQNKPEPAKIATIEESKEAKKEKHGKNKRGRPQSIEVDEEAKEMAQTKPAKETPSQGPAPSKISPPNLLIPSVRQTFRLVENPSILQQLARLLLQTHQPPARHVFLTKDTFKIKNALAIGVHGLFPAPLLRTVIGQPTGTSIKFASHAASAIRRWAESHGSADVEVQNVALESEGKIADRVDNLWKLLLNWIDQIRKADFILVACHSQGVPVAIMLVSKLIEFGVVSSGRIGVCAMAGVSLGPFPDYKSRLLSGSAGELFEFANPESVISKRYEDALRIALRYGVRISYCGSIDDQLVSMESSTFSIASHPYIFRSVFVDGRIHAPDFLSHLVGFALKLRNLGISDHGLIRELSAPLAGSLYTGEGHSRLYDDPKVYDLAVEFALETTPTPSQIPLALKKYEVPNSANANPYVLPWIMRGLLEEDFVKTELGTETNELLKQFDDWKPATKVLKDVKYRLEAVRSKL